MNSTKLAVGGFFTMTCKDKHGNVKWREEFDNMVVNEGLSHILQRIFYGTESSGESNSAPWFIGLLNSGGSVSATDGIADLPEFTTYDGTRKEFLEVIDVTSPAAPQMDNSASKAEFTIASGGSDETVGGAFLASVDTGSTGVLLCGGAFSGGDKTGLDEGDTLEVQYTFIASNS